MTIITANNGIDCVIIIIPQKTAVTTSITVEIRAVDINSYISLTLLKRFSISPDEWLSK